MLPSGERLGSAVAPSTVQTLGVLKPGPARTTPRSVTRELIIGTAPLPQVPVHSVSTRPCLPNQSMQLSATAPPNAPTAASLLSKPQPTRTPQLRPRSLGGGASASFAMAPKAMLRQPAEAAKTAVQEAGYAARIAPLVVRSSDMANPLMRQQSEAPPVPQAPAAPVQSKLTVMSPRLTTRPDAINPEALKLHMPGPRDDLRQSAAHGPHPARSTLHICRPNTGSVTVRPTGGGTVDMSQRVRTSSPGFRRDQSYRTSLPASLSPANKSAALSPRGGCLGPASKSIAAPAAVHSLQRHQASS
jgi:hypothetical protein